MALTVSQATSAGQIAAKITALQLALSTAQDALANNMVVTSHGLHMLNASGKKASVVSSDYQLGTIDSNTVLTTLILAYQNSIAVLNAQLAGM